MNSRFKYIDIARGLAILFIVLGHTLVYSENCKEIYTFLYSFHVAFFFIISGYTFKLPNNYWMFLKKNLLRIMLPYFVWSFIFMLPYILLGQMLLLKSVSSSSFDILIQVKNIFYGNGNGFALKQNSSLWFLPALFSTKMLYGLVLRILDKSYSLKTDILYGGIIFALGFLTTKLMSEIFLPWGINTALQFGIFFYIGYIIKKDSLLEKEYRNIIIIILAFIIGIIACFANSQRVSAIDYRYGNYVLAIISGIAISFVILKLCKRMKSNRVLEYIGKNTMGILIFHKIVIIISQTKLGIVTRLLKESTWYIEFFIALIVMIVAVVFSLIINKFMQKVRPILVGKSNFIK